MASKPVIVNVLRGNLIESRHTGHLAVVDCDGNLCFQAGDPYRLTYARSCAKPLQALSVVESGAAEQFSLSQRELALLCASHNGEEKHVEAAESILSKLSLTAAALQCGPQEPAFKKAAEKLCKAGNSPTSLHNNCSGKHVGMLALSLHLGADTDHYMEPDHPVQKLMLKTVAEMSGAHPETIPLAIDGCGVPVFGLRLANLAYAFAKFGRPQGLAADRAAACRTLYQAIRAEPYYLAGSDRYDTRLAEITDGAVIGKMGAEGVFALSIPDRGWGMALKITDGSERALYPAVTEALRQISALSPEQMKLLRPFHYPAIRNRTGTVVGSLQTDLQLRKSGREKIFN